MGMMGKALLPRASESVLHAEKRRLLWGAKPFKAIGYSSAVSCSPVIPGRYRNPSLPDVRYLFVANRSDFYSGCCTRPCSAISELIPEFDSPCKLAIFSSGAGGIRTPDLRRAKSGHYRRRRSSLFRKSCKTAYSLYKRLAIFHRRSRGLVYHWCKRTLA